MSHRFYQLLGVSPSASKTQIRKSYIKLAKQYHPDINSSPNAQKQFQAIEEAYRALSNPKTVETSNTVNNDSGSWHEFWARSHAEEFHWKQSQKKDTFTHKSWVSESSSAAIRSIPFALPFVLFFALYSTTKKGPIQKTTIEYDKSGRAYRRDEQGVLQRDESLDRILP